MKLVLTILVLLSGGYALLAVYAWIFSDGQLFYPQFGSDREPQGLIRIPGENGDSLAAVFLPTAGATYTLWYFHGNAEDLGDLDERVALYRQMGYSVFAVEYPGYGLNKGKPAEDSIYAATREGLRYLTTELGVPRERIIAYGRSLGGGPATELALRESIGGLILESTFTSAFRVVTRRSILPFDKFDNLKKLPQVSCPILIMHGREDRVIAFSHGEALFAAAREPKQHLWVKAADHNDLLEWAGERYGQALQKFTAGLSQIGRTKREGQ